MHDYNEGERVMMMMTLMVMIIPMMTVGDRLCVFCCVQGPEGRDGIPGVNGLPGPPGHVFVIPVSCAVKGY